MGTCILFIIVEAATSIHNMSPLDCSIPNKIHLDHLDS